MEVLGHSFFLPEEILSDSGKAIGAPLLYGYSTYPELLVVTEERLSAEGCIDNGLLIEGELTEDDTAEGVGNASRIESALFAIGVFWGWTGTGVEGEGSFTLEFS